MLYPEHEKLKNFISEAEIIQEFLEIMQQKQIVLAEYRDECLYTLNNNEQIIAEYFGINLKILESEREEILKSIRVL